MIFHRLKGFTLIEIIVSVGIIGILVAGFLPIISSSYFQVFNLGKDSQSLIDANSDIQLAITDFNSGEDNVNTFETKITYKNSTNSTTLDTIFVQSKIEDFNNTEEKYLYGYSKTGIYDYKFRAVNFAYLDVNKNRAFDPGIDIYVPRTEEEYNKVKNSPEGIPQKGGNLSTFNAPCYTTYLENPSGVLVRYNYYGADLILPGNMDEPFINVDHNIRIECWGNIILSENVKLESKGEVKLVTRKNIFINRGNITANRVSLHAAERKTIAPNQGFTTGSNNTINGYIYIKSSSIIAKENVLFQARKNVSISGNKKYGTGIVAKNRIEIYLTGKTNYYIDSNGVSQIMFTEDMLSATNISIDRIDDEEIYSEFKYTGIDKSLGVDEPGYIPPNSFREIVDSSGNLDMVQPVAFSGFINKKSYAGFRVFVSRRELP